ncbi:PAB-dependent poly(A)-specific ribonuclease subunit 3 [Homalodisca vitripennis]|nr:PAB-dependent poly(A)-specific ribonuclease subunit 3 [Homalodisca vitripennis]
MDQIRQCMDNKEPSRVKFRRAEPDPPLLAVRSARLEYQFASVWRITDRTRAPTTEKFVHSVFTTVGQTIRTTRSAKESLCVGRFLLTGPSRRSVVDLMPMIGARYYTYMDTTQLQCDILENELAKEMENGRLCRLLVKLATINERPE